MCLKRNWSPDMFRVLMATLAVVGAFRAVGGETTDYPIRPVPFTQVKVNDVFWAPKIETNRVVTVPFALQKNEETGRVDNFRKAAGLMKGSFQGKRYNDSDIYKVMEGAAYTLMLSPDPKLVRTLDDLIAVIAKAQEPDGYLFTTRTIDPMNPAPGAGAERWSNLRISHEFYNVGHMYEAAVAHFQATGKRSFLDIAVKNADLLLKTFGPGRRRAFPGHQEIEIGLSKLFRVTGNRAYLDLAKFFLDERGRYFQGEKHAPDDPFNVYDSYEYLQNHKPVLEQDEAVGHAVRAMYMYAGMADVAALGGYPEYVRAIDRLWDNVVGKKMYLSFFYQNPLEADGKSELYQGQVGRAPWFEVACCPPNITRFLPSVPGYVYAVQGDSLFVNLFLANTASVYIAGIKVSLAQDTRYPWDSTVKIEVKPDESATFTLRVRIPGWARNEPVPTDLYRFLDASDEKPVLKINGSPAAIRLDKGYAVIRRIWAKGDVVELNLPMPIRRILANDAVKADAGRVAFQRGPLVFCAEGLDNDGRALDLTISDTSRFTAEFKPDLLKGVVVLKGKAPIVPASMSATTAGESGAKIKTDPIRTGAAAIPAAPAGTKDRDVILIPYYVWANRGPGEMRVWFPRR